MQLVDINDPAISKTAIFRQIINPVGMEKFITVTASIGVIAGLVINVKKELDRGELIDRLEQLGYIQTNSPDEIHRSRDMDGDINTWCVRKYANGDCRVNMVYNGYNDGIFMIATHTLPGFICTAVPRGPETILRLIGLLDEKYTGQN